MPDESDLEKEINKEELFREFTSDWVFVYEDNPCYKKIIQALHKPWEYMKRGRQKDYRRMRRNMPSRAIKFDRCPKTKPYHREVAGGGYKNN